MQGLADVAVADGDLVAPALVLRALTASELLYPDGATQNFDADGRTTYVEHGQPTDGTWSIDQDGRFESFWPPSYRNTYDLHWVVIDGTIVGLRFTDPQQVTEFVGRYRR